MIATAIPGEVDLAVIGAGPAGIAAAACAAERGRRVLLLDAAPRIGGQIWRHRDRASLPTLARRWMARLERSGAVVACGASVADVRREDDGFLIVAETPIAPRHVRAARIVLATGARERFLPFPGWTLPGVVGVGGAQALLKQGMRVSGKRVVLAGSGPLMLPVAASLATAGARIAFVAEQARGADVRAFALSLWRRPALALQGARYRARFLGAPYGMSAWPMRAEGDDRVRSVTLVDERGERTIACDLLCTGFGLVPSTELAELIGCEVAHGAVVVSDAQESSVRGVYSAGESTGIGGMPLALAEGEIAGRCAAGDAVPPARAARRRARERVYAAVLERAFAPRAELASLATPETIVCRCEDVTRSAMHPEWSCREAKLLTRAGMGPCQGRVCGPALEQLFGWPRDRVRPPVEPVLLSTLILDATPTEAPRSFAHLDAT